jgi:hypothetical protein
LFSYLPYASYIIFDTTHLPLITTDRLRTDSLGVPVSSYRFSEIETVAVLTLFVMQYKIEVTDDPKFPPGSETFEEKRQRVLDATVDSILLRPVKVPLTFKRRNPLKDSNRFNL